jgi:putative Mg2+ transporter-C (MgtC) family protein
MFNGIISELELQLLLDLALSLIAGFIIGAERESRGKDAGISTHTMVIIGAMLFTFLSANVDPASQSRIAAQIVSGIGFLGAGLIIKDGTNVRNLTTAASIWVSGAIGMAFGFNFHVVGLIVAVAAALTPRIPHINKKSPESLTTYGEENNK